MKLSLAKHNRRPVPSRDNISNNVQRPSNLNLLNFVKSVTPRFCGPVGLMSVCLPHLQ